jgi:hypothetical protein
MSSPDQPSWWRPRLRVRVLMLLVALVGLGLAWVKWSVPRVAVIDLGPPNRIVVEQRPYTVATLGRFIRSEGVERVVVRCSPEMPYNSVAQILRAIEGAGVRKIHLTTAKCGLPPNSRAPGP